MFTVRIIAGKHNLHRTATQSWNPHPPSSGSAHPVTRPLICLRLCQFRLRHDFQSSLALTPRSAFSFQHLPSAMPVWTSSLFSKLASAHSAFSFSP
jgi:hypothetical protein